jgi:MFS family permease
MLAIAYVISYVDRVLLALLVEPIKQHLQVSDTSMSFLLGLGFALFYATLGLPIARIADRASRTTVIVVGMALWSVATALTGFANRYLSLFLARVAVGVGEATLTPAAYSMLSDYFAPRNLPRAMGLYHAGGIVGIGGGFMIGGAVAQLAVSAPNTTLPIIGALHAWQVAFVVVGLPGVLFALLFAMTVREPGRVRSERDSSFGTSWRNCRSFVGRRWRTYTALLMGPGICAIAVFGVFSWMPTYLGRNFSWSPGQTGLWFGLVVMISNIGGYLGAPFFADWLRRRGHQDALLRASLYAVLIGALPAAAGFLMPTPLLTLMFWGVGAFFYTMPFVLCPTGIQLVTPNQFRATVSAGYILLTNLIGLAMGPTLAALIAEHGFESRLALGKALAILCVTALPLGAIAFQVGRRTYVRGLAEMGLDQPEGILSPQSQVR